jgi:hypothetical protein
MQHHNIRTYIATRLLSSNTARPARGWYRRLALCLLIGTLGAACVVSADPEPVREPYPLPGSDPAPAPAPAPAPTPEAKPDPAVLVIDRTAHDFGLFHVGEKSEEMVFTVRNGGPEPISGLALHWEQGIGFTVTATTCTGWLEPSALCTLAGVFAPVQAGAVQTDLVVQASNLAARTTLAGMGAATLRIVNHVAGYGVEVLSDPAGISCGAICEATFTSHEIVLDKGLFELTAWSGPCEPITESACLLRLEGDTTVELQFYEPGLLWSESIGQVTSVATDAENNVIVSGDYDTGLVKYSPDGDLLWQVETSGDAYDIAVDAHGNIGFFASYEGMLQKRDGAGNLQWTVETSPFAWASVAFDPSGNLHVAGTIYSWENGTYSGRIHKYDPSGALLWTRDYAAGEQTWDVAVDQDGNTLVLINEVVYHEDRTEISSSLHKYDGDGGLLWMTAVFDGANHLAVDTTGNIFLSSYTGDILIEKRSPDGNHLWFTAMTDLGMAVSLAATPAGDVIVLGHRQFGDGPYDREGSAVELDGTTGERQGRILIRSDIAATWSSGIAVDREGDLIIAGTFDSFGFWESWLRKYDGAVFD